MLNLVLASPNLINLINNLFNVIVTKNDNQSPLMTIDFNICVCVEHSVEWLPEINKYLISFMGMENYI